MNILIVSQYFWPENFRINDLAQEWVARGHRVTVLTGVPNYPGGVVFDAFSAAPESFDAYAGARVMRVPMLARSSGAVPLPSNTKAWRMRRSACESGFMGKVCSGKVKNLRLKCVCESGIQREE